MEWLMPLEEFSRQFQYTMQFLLALATWIIIYITLNQTKTKLTAILMLCNGALRVKVSNNGLLPVHFQCNDFLFLKIPFKDPERISPGVPVGINQSLLPNTTESVDWYINMTDIKNTCLNKKNQCCFKKIITKIKLRWFLRFVTSNGQMFRIKVSRDIRKKITDEIEKN